MTVINEISRPADLLGSALLNCLNQFLFPHGAEKSPKMEIYFFLYSIYPVSLPEFRAVAAKNVRSTGNTEVKNSENIIDGRIIKINTATILFTSVLRIDVGSTDSNGSGAMCVCVLFKKQSIESAYMMGACCVVSIQHITLIK